MDVILGLLHKRPLTGYEIKSTFQNLFVYFFDASFGTIYPALGKLEKLGYITKQSVPQDNRPMKNVYTLTDRGRNQFERYLESPVEKESYRSDFLTRLYFGEHAEPESTRRWMKSELANGVSGLRKLEEKKSRMWDAMTPTQQICLTMGIEQAKTRIKVLEEGLGKLETP